METKICIKCDTEKPLDKYSFIRKTGKHNNTCRSCKTEMAVAWRNQHRPQYEDTSKKRYERVATAERERVAQWRAANPERSREAKNRCYEARRDHYRAKHRKYAEDHKNDPRFLDACRSRTRNRRARIRAAEGFHSAADIARLYVCQSGKCATCTASLDKRYEVDHIMPIALGGSNWPDNLQLLCPPCNRRKNAKHPDEWARENRRLF